jgi:hypothetical protein
MVALRPYKLLMKRKKWRLKNGTKTAEKKQKKSAKGAPSRAKSASA